MMLCSYSVSQAQSTNYQILLQSGYLLPEANVKEVAALETPLAKELVNGKYYRLIQFYQIPGNSEKQSLAQTGIELMDYLPYHTFIAAIPAAFDLSTLTQYGVRAIVPLKENFKINKYVSNYVFPEHATTVAGKTDLSVRYHNNLSEAEALASLNKSGIEVLTSYALTNHISIRVSNEKVKDIVNNPAVLFVEPVSPPSTPDDTEARSLHRSNAINSDYPMGRHYDGTGVSAALGDDGGIGPHIDYKGRLTHMLGLPPGGGGTHGDMTSGILMGAGNVNQSITGHGTGTYLYYYDIGGYNHLLDMPTTSVNLGVRLSSTSYSQGCNEYTSDTQTGDQIIRMNPNLVHVFSAGNNGNGNCNYGAGSGWGNITGGYKQGKNVISCANLNNLDILEASSSRGPASDGRVKPDISANGYNQLSTAQNNNYQVGGGTSAACPSVAGTYSQLIHAYRELNAQADPESPLLKACILNTAHDLGNVGPDFQHGWGRINALRSVMTLEDNRYMSDTISQGSANTHTIAIPGGVLEARIMLYWLDWEGNPLSAKALVNDLNLTVEDPSSTISLPLVLDPTPNVAALTTPAAPGVDDLNNMEQVRLLNPAAGNYTVHVDGFQVPQGPQKYYIVYEFLTDEITVTYPMGGESFAPGEFQILRWDAHGSNDPFLIDYTTDGGLTWNVISAGTAPQVRQYSWFVPSTLTGHARVRITRNAVTDESDADFSIMTLPTGLIVDTVCPTYAHMSWASVPNATGYDAQKLGAMYMEFDGNTANNGYTYTGLTLSDEDWFSVRALGPNDAISRRAIATAKPTSLLNCVLAVDAAVAQVVPASMTIPSCQAMGTTEIKAVITNGGQNPISNFDISYVVDGGTPVTETFSGSINQGGIAVHTFTTQANLSTVGTHVIQVYLGIAGDGNIFNDTLVSSVNTVSSNIVSTFPYTEDFESYTLCNTSSDCEATVCPLGNGLINVESGFGDDIDWRVDEGGTPSSNTGPAVDQNPGTASGNYVYTEASNGCTGKSAVLLTPCFNLAGMNNPQFSFGYHMYGLNQGQLAVSLIVDGAEVPNAILPVNGNQGNTWFTGNINLQPYVGSLVTVVFRGTTGGDFASDMALDNFNLSEGVGTNDLSAIDHLVSVSPNPSNALFTLSINAQSNTDIHYAITDLQGRLLQSKDLKSTIGVLNEKIDLSDLAKGVYILNVEMNGESKQMKLMLQ